MTILATWNGTVIAESDRTIVLEGRHYFPIADVKWEFLEASSHHTVCPWKGQASYFTVVVDGERNANAAWALPLSLSACERDHGTGCLLEGGQDHIFG